jgi:protein phosphatase
MAANQMNATSPLIQQALRITRITDTGLVRTRNEDTVASDASIGLAVLADGMGGYNAGDIASQIATLVITAELKTYFETANQTDSRTLSIPLLHQQILQAAQIANQAIYQASTTRDECAGMGTTLVMTVFIDNQVCVGHIGDSRAYLFRHDQLIQLTHDHSVLQEQLDYGLITPAQAKVATYKNFVTRALGVSHLAEMEINHYPVAVGDLFLLCSDGLTDMVDDEEIALILHQSRNDIEVAAQNLIKIANLNGGKDNISVIIIEVVEQYPLQQLTWFQSIIRKFIHKGQYG